MGSLANGCFEGGAHGFDRRAAPLFRLTLEVLDGHDVHLSPAILRGGRHRLRGPFGLSRASAQLQPVTPATAAAPPAVIPILHPTPQTLRPRRIGVIGAGRVGATIGELWLRAGHEVMFADRDPEVLKALVGRLPRARTGSNAEAARFGDAILFSAPYSALPEINRELSEVLRNKVVIDASNPVPRRDGEMAEAALLKGSGVATAEHLPTARVARAFNAIRVVHMGSEAHRPGEKVGIPIAADDKRAMALVQSLVRDAGFEPVAVGDLSTAGRFEMLSPALGPHTAAKLRSILGISP